MESSLLLIPTFNLPGKLSSNFSGLFYRQASNMIMVIPVLNRLREGVNKKNSFCRIFKVNYKVINYYSDMHPNKVEIIIYFASFKSAIFFKNSLG